MLALRLGSGSRLLARRQQLGAGQCRSLVRASVARPAAQFGDQRPVQPHDPESAASEVSTSGTSETLSELFGALSSTVAGKRETWSRASLGVALATSLWLLLSDAAWASGGSFSGEALDVFTGFLDKVEAMGPTGYVVFVLVVMVSEMIPLFPTQPLSLASGLLFGAVQGSALMLLGVTLAAVNAFVISRGIGRGLAEKVIHYEMDDDGSGPNSTHALIAQKLSEVQRTIETGSFTQQLVAVTLLRLTPVVPFSASNYVLGLTPLQLPAFLLGTLAGMSVWSVVYGSLGGAGRSLLESGMDLGSVFTELAAQSSSMTRPVLIGAGALAGVAGLVYAVRRSGGPEAAAAVAAQAGDGGSNGNGSGNGSGKAGNGNGNGNGNGVAKADSGVEVLKEEHLLRK